MQLPSVNLNGSSHKSLTEQYMTAYEAMQAAIDAVRALDVHGRDYQTIANSNAASDAMREHVARLQSLEQIKNDYEMILLSLQE